MEKVHYDSKGKPFIIDDDGSRKYLSIDPPSQPSTPSGGDGDGCLAVVGVIFLCLVISAVIYLGGGSLLKSIWNSISPIEGDMTILDIYRRELMQYNILCGVFCALISMILDEDENLAGWLSVIIPGASFIIVGHILPMSEAAAILNTIVCIITMTFYSYRWWEKQ